MDILVIGSGSREHAIAWKLAQSPQAGKIYIAPGNGGTSEVAESVAMIGVMEFDKLADFAATKNIGLTVVGPDDPLGAGIVDVFKARGLTVFGPTKAAAQIEASKAFAKTLMRECGVPTAAFETFTDYTAARAYLAEHGAPIVVKASGLALGKGVYVCHSMEEAEKALKDIMVDRAFKDAGNEVVIEEYLEGPEISIHALTDGEDYLLFPTSQDHKRSLEGDEGPNTGGMGVVGPLPWVSAVDMDRIGREIVEPILEGLKSRGAAFTGLLYPGIMMTKDGPKVLEFNARFGQPECEVYMRLMESDLVELMLASAEGDLSSKKITWKDGYCANICLVSGGYPGEYKKGYPITGIEEAERVEGVKVFHMGTTYDGMLKTAGGRVLAVTALGATLQEALDRAYEAAGHIHFDHMRLRRDIGAKAIRGIAVA